MAENPFPFRGLSTAEAEQSAALYGYNTTTKSSNPVWGALRDAVTEPMFFLLLICAVIYFILGETSEAWFMTGAVMVVAGISFYQDTRSRKATEALSQYTKPEAKVIRNNEVQAIPSESIVKGDFVVVSEGEFVPADGIIVQMNDLSVMESILTGESFPVTKDITDPERNTLYQGTIVSGGLAVMKVHTIGSETRLGKIARSVIITKSGKSPLQVQIGNFVRNMALVGIICFLLIWLYHYQNTGEIWYSLLQGLTIAMSILPEEIPVAYSTFMALGAWRLLKSGIIVKRTQVVEALGAANVLCVDKTGTITQNKMKIAYLWLPDNQIIEYPDESNIRNKKAELLEYAMWASEPVPFDPMEISLHNAYGDYSDKDRRSEFTMLHEYPLSGQPPMMTHIFRNIHNDEIIAACKGAPEAVLSASRIPDEIKELALLKTRELSANGNRVLAVGKCSNLIPPFPERQDEINIEFLGLVAFYDPPKDNITEVLDAFENAGIEVKMVTGDISETAVAIAKQSGFRNADKVINASEFEKLDEKQAARAANENFIFTRMYPELKLKLIESLIKSGKITGMTGDGVNDGPALKAAHIGIAMGKRGTEIARQAASIILTNDDISGMVDAVAMGRKIHTNLKKAIRYIISIHIPIILTVAIPLFLAWEYPVIFTPVHIIFFELVMGPTCSIVYENEPIEKNLMQKPPESLTQNYLSAKELSISLIQGLMITAGIMIIYRVVVNAGADENTLRSVLFLSIIISNVLLTLVNRSFYFSIFECLTFKNRLLPGIIGITILLTLLLYLHPVVASFFKITLVSPDYLGLILGVSVISVGWIELYKFLLRKNNPLKIKTAE